VADYRVIYMNVDCPAKSLPNSKCVISVIEPDSAERYDNACVLVLEIKC